LTHTIARIRFDGGMLMLPSRTPYDIELLIENLDWYTARYHAVQFEIDRSRWQVVHEPAEKGEGCARCERGAVLTFVSGTRVPLCASCARAAMSTRFADWPRSDAYGRAIAAD
jgi:hypothetical protein